VVHVEALNIVGRDNMSSWRCPSARLDCDRAGVLHRLLAGGQRSETARISPSFSLPRLPCWRCPDPSGVTPPLTVQGRLSAVPPYMVPKRQKSF